SSAPTATGPNIRSAAAAPNAILHVRIALDFHARSGMGHGAGTRRTDLVCVFPQIAASELRRLRLPSLGPGRELGLGQLDIERALLGVEHDHVAVPDKPDRTAHGRLGADMAHAEAARRAGETAVGDERHLVAHALAVKRGGGGEHLAHAGAPLRAL